MCELNSIRKQDLLEHLQSICKMMSIKNQSDWKYSCMEHFVLENGQMFHSITPRNPSIKGIPKQCFGNAGKLFMDDHFFGEKKYSYVEGYAYGSVLPVQHAWLITHKGAVIETTWPSNGDAYYGVIIPWPYFRKIVNERQSGGIIDNMEMQFPLVSGKHTLETT